MLIKIILIAHQLNDNILMCRAALIIFSGGVEQSTLKTSITIGPLVTKSLRINIDRSRVIEQLERSGAKAVPRFKNERKKKGDRTVIITKGFLCTLWLWLYVMIMIKLCDYGFEFDESQLLTRPNVLISRRIHYLRFNSPTLAVVY